MAITKVVVESRTVTPGKCIVGPPQCQDVTDCGNVVPQSCPPCPPDFTNATAHITDLDDPTFVLDIPMTPLNFRLSLVGYDSGPLTPLAGGIIARVGVTCGIFDPGGGRPSGAYVTASVLIGLGTFVLAVGFTDAYPADCVYKRGYGLLIPVPGLATPRLQLTVS